MSITRSMTAISNLRVTIPAADVNDQVSSFEHRRRVRAVRELGNDLRAARERIHEPVRIRPEPKNRDLAQEEQIDHEHIAHHQRRHDEEITEVRHKFARGRHLARLVFSLNTDKLQEKYKKRVLRLANGDGDHWEVLHTLSIEHGKKLQHEAGVCQIKLQRLSTARETSKIGSIHCRRHELSWTCPNDGQAHPFTWEGNNYHRTYDGEMWLTENWEWRGEWAGYYIAHGNPPQDCGGW